MRALLRQPCSCPAACPCLFTYLREQQTHRSAAVFVDSSWPPTTPADHSAWYADVPGLGPDRKFMYSCHKGPLLTARQDVLAASTQPQTRVRANSRRRDSKTHKAADPSQQTAARDSKTHKAADPSQQTTGVETARHSRSQSQQTAGAKTARHSRSQSQQTAGTACCRGHRTPYTHTVSVSSAASHAFPLVSTYCVTVSVSVWHYRYRQANVAQGA